MSLSNFCLDISRDQKDFQIDKQLLIASAVLDYWNIGNLKT